MVLEITHMGRGRQRRRHKPAEPCDNAAASTLRLVRSENENVQDQPISAGLPDTAVDRVADDGGCPGVAAEETGGGVLEPAAPARSIELRRSFDPGDINPILNEPSVFRFAGSSGIDHIDAGPIVADERNVLLMADNGGILFCLHEPCCYEVHTNFLRRGSAGLAHGMHVLKCSIAAYRWMFTRTDCITLITRIPKHNRPALRLAPLAGWVTEFERKLAWPSVDAGMVDLAFCSIRYDDWVRRTDDLFISGRKFVRALNLEFVRHGRDGADIVDDAAMDRHLGACVEMLSGGQSEKAVALYNRWARFAGMGGIALVSATRRMIDIGSALVEVLEDGTPKVILVR